MTIGQRIRILREEKGLSQVDLADAANTTKQTIYKYEGDIITNIPSDKIELIANKLGTTPSFLMGWNEEIRNMPNDEDVKFALYGTDRISDEVYNAVKAFAELQLQQLRKEGKVQ